MSAGYCANCIVEGIFFFGSAERFLSYGGVTVAPRRNRLSFALNLNFLRAGARF
ncbi:MAG TPA: hypothetical protein VK524_22330 [Polyangiaceae bacterium]|nr:hypothetical protein [Polyangiaceae bacterium]